MTRSEKVALVTGAGSGIGASVCERLAREGFLIAAADANEAGLDQLKALPYWQSGFLTRTLDVRDVASQVAFVETIEKDIGAISAVVPCAGLTRSGPAESMPVQDWQLALDVNLTGTFLTCQAAARPMLRRGRGAIVCIASIAAKGGQPGRANYVASKFAVAGLVKSLAVEWGGRGIRVNAVSPGVVATPMVINGVPERFQDVMRDRIPLRRFSEPSEVAAAIALLLSEDASYINGVLLEVDGGITAGYMTSRNGDEYGIKAAQPSRIEPETGAATMEAVSPHSG